MGLNIKKPSVESAIRELAAITNQGLTEAVESAVLEKLQRLKQAKRAETAEELLERLRPLQEALAAERRARGDTRTSQELLDELYDEHGLPK
jgi:antitoxin VapB